MIIMCTGASGRAKYDLPNSPYGSSLDISLEAEGGFLISPRGAPQLLSDNAVPEILF